MSNVESSKLPDVIDSKAAADSLREHTAMLVKTCRHCLSSLADSLYSQSIIPEDAHRKAQRESLDEDESRALVSCVEARLEIEPSDFKKFVDIIKSEPFFGILGSKLVQSYNCTLSSIPPAKQTATISPAISQYAAYLKGVYRNSPISPDGKWPPTPSKKYIKLAAVLHGYKCRGEFIGHTLHDTVEEMLKSRKEISIDKILVPEEDVAYLKLILIEGAPGMGKSTLAWELCRRWEQGCMKKYSLTVLLRLREKAVQEIRSIAELFFFCQGKDVLIEEISSSNGKGVLFILDGFDELPTTLQKEGFLVNIIRGTFLPESTVLVTSRPSATAELLTICRPQIQKRIEILGFTQESVKEYATNIFSSEPERLQRFKGFISLSKNPAIDSLMYVPLNAAIIVEIYHHSKSNHLLPHTLTQVYTQLCLTILNRYLQTTKYSIRVNKLNDLPSHLYQELLTLSKIAFDGLRGNEVIFQALPSNLVHFGFLDAVSSLYGGGSVSYNFLHLTLQEFFAAYHISQHCGDARLAFLGKYAHDNHFDLVWMFVSGITEFKFFEGHIDSLFGRGRGKDDVEVYPLFVKCLFEANIKMDKSKLFRPEKNILVKPYHAFDSYALGYCIANLTSGVSWNIDCHYCDARSLTNGLKTNDNTSSNVIRLTIYLSSVYLYLEHFPLRSITCLRCCRFTSSDLIYLSRSLSSMISLQTLGISQSKITDLQCFSNILQQLPQTSVTSLNVTNTALTESPSALKPLIDPQMGKLEELHAGWCHPCQELDDTLLLDMVSTPSSLKSLILEYPHNISSLTQLKMNTNLTQLRVNFELVKDVEVMIVEILKCNKTLEQLSVGEFKLPEDISCISSINEALPKNNTLGKIMLQIINPNISDVSSHMKANHPELVLDSRIFFNCW